MSSYMQAAPSTTYGTRRSFILRMSETATALRGLMDERIVGEAGAPPRSAPVRPRTGGTAPHCVPVGQVEGADGAS
jgi:hypothetical protein